MDLRGTFDVDADQTLLSLRDLFISRVNQNREKRLQMNSQNPMMRVSRITYLTNIFMYLKLNDCLVLGQTCIFFNQLVKSPLFVKYMVLANQKTKVDISLGAFGQGPSSNFGPTSQQHIMMSRGMTQDLLSSQSSSSASLRGSMTAASSMGIGMVAKR